MGRTTFSKRGSSLQKIREARKQYIHSNSHKMGVTKKVSVDLKDLLPETLQLTLAGAQLRIPRKVVLEAISHNPIVEVDASVVFNALDVKAYFTRRTTMNKPAYKKKKKKKKQFPPAKGNKFPSTPADPSAEYEVSHIKNFVWKQGKALFTIAWEGTDENGKAWPDTVEPDDHLPEVLIRDYFEHTALHPSMMKWRGYHKRTYPNAFPDNKIILAAEEEEAKTSYVEL